MPTSDIKKGPLYVDSTNNRVGIGTSSPNKSLTVATPQTANTAMEVLRLTGSGVYNSSGSSEAGAGVSFGQYSGTYPSWNLGQISGVRSGASWDGALIFSTNSGSTETSITERMRIDSSGRVGIGTSSPASLLHLDQGSGGEALRFERDSYDTMDIELSESGFRIRNETDGRTDFFIDGSGNVALNGSVRDSSRFTINGNVSNPNLQSWQNTTSLVSHFWFRNPNGIVGAIITNGSSTAYNTSSDYRLKENVTDITDATTRLKQLNPVRFNFIADADTTVDGFLAHEVQTVVPEAISGTHDEVDDDGNPVYQGIDQSKLVPLLVKTIQELEARIVALEAN